LKEDTYYGLMTASVPCWYELGTEGKATIVRIRNEVFAALVPKAREYDFPKVIGPWQLGEFKPPSQGRWGYAKRLSTRASNRAGWQEVRCRLPRLSELVDGDRQANWLLGCQISASLAFLLIMLDELDLGPKERSPCQLVNRVSLGLGASMGGFGLRALISKQLADWLLSQPDQTDFPGVRLKLASIFNHLWPGLGARNEEFFAGVVYSGGLTLAVPGMACDFCGYPMDVEPGAGHVMNSHNVDNPIQQLSLLYGLAAVHDLAREAGI